MIVFYYTDIDNLEKIFASTSDANSSIVLEAMHRCYLADDPQRIFGRYLLPSCIEEIERELGIDPSMALSPLVKNPAYMQKLLDSVNTFDDHNAALETFVLSFYEDQDNIELWKRDGNCGRGVAIGFDTDRLKPEYKNLFNVYTGKCSYWSDEVMSDGYHLDSETELYTSIKKMYGMLINPEVVESFKVMYGNEAHAAAMQQRIKDTLVAHLVKTFDVYNKYDTMRCEREYRMSLTLGPTHVRYMKNEGGDYIPVADVTIPVESIRMMVLGDKCGKNAYGMIKSLLRQKGVSQEIPVLGRGRV